MTESLYTHEMHRQDLAFNVKKKQILESWFKMADELKTS